MNLAGKTINASAPLAAASFACNASLETGLMVNPHNQGLLRINRSTYYLQHLILLLSIEGEILTCVTIEQ